MQTAIKLLYVVLAVFFLFAFFDNLINPLAIQIHTDVQFESNARRLDLQLAFMIELELIASQIYIQINLKACIRIQLYCIYIETTI